MSSTGTPQYVLIPVTVVGDELNVLGCARCGCWVWDQAAHDDWHGYIDATAMSAATGVKG